MIWSVYNARMKIPRGPTLPVVWVIILLLSIIGANATKQSLAEAALPSPAVADYRSDEVIVRLRPGASLSSLQPYALGYALRLHANLKPLNALLLKVPPGRVEAVVQVLSRAPAVIFAEPNYLVHAAVITPSDPAWPNQYGPVQIQAPQAWTITTGTSAVAIAVIDTGVDLNHPDLADKIWNNPDEIPSNGVDDDNDGYVDDWRGWDFVNGDNDPQDDYGHGTHVAGIAAAASNNAVGIAGIAWGARLMPLKILDSRGDGANSDLALAMRWAADHGAQVINLSLGDPPPDPLMEEAVDYAVAHGAVVIAAAGNSGHSGVLYPGAYANAIAVAATDASNYVASFSSVGPQVDVAAPGVSIYSTYWSATSGSTYNTLSGTSMATPHVAGVAALLAALPQFNTPAKIRAALESTTLLLTSCHNPQTGFGLVQAYAALQFDLSAPPRACYLHFLPLVQLW